MWRGTNFDLKYVTVLVRFAKTADINEARVTITEVEKIIVDFLVPATM